MHDTFLLKKISSALKDTCKENGIKRVEKLYITTHFNSHIHEGGLHEHLLIDNGDLIGKWTDIKIKRSDIEEQTAIIEKIEGESLDQNLEE